MSRTITRDLTATELDVTGDTYCYRVRSMFGPATVSIPANHRDEPELEAVTKYLTDKTPANTDVTIHPAGDGRYRIVISYRAPRVIPVR